MGIWTSAGVARHLLVLKSSVEGLYCKTGSCRHLCENLCYFREYEPARQLHALRERAASHPLRPSLDGWTARIALTYRAPFWCVVLHDSAGAVRGSPKEAWEGVLNDALTAPLAVAGQS